MFFGLISWRRSLVVVIRRASLVGGVVSRRSMIGSLVRRRSGIGSVVHHACDVM